MERYEHKKVEQKWRDKWDASDVYKTTEDENKEKFYILDMFPYPSGKGLHVGHPKGYIATDIISRYKKMNGFNVLHPMGWDAFGLPAEQYALKNKVHPSVGTDKNIETFKKQLEKISLNYDWEREISTTDPEFYKWTQWAFIQMYKKGLVFQSNEPINWCPSCKTGLANEDLENGACERCDTPIEKKKIPQWVIKITDYADRLLEDLDKLDWQEHIKELQKNWIGKSEGAKIEFKIKNEELKIDDLNVILVHGCPSDKEKAMDEQTRTYDKHWLPWIKEKLEQNNIKVDFPLMPHPWEPVYAEHKKEFEKLNINENSILIGHSCGANFLVRWLSETNIKIKKLILVAPWSEPNHQNKVKAEFYDISSVDYSFVNNIVDGVVIFTSDNEEKIGKDTAKMWREKLNANLIELKNHGYYTEGGMGTVEFLELLDEIIVKPNVVLMHGKNVDSSKKWYPWLADEMQKRNIKFTAPKLPKSDDPDIKEWMNELDRLNINKESILIGYSRGGVAILRWLEKQPKDFKVKKIILVATNSGDSAKRNKTENNKGFFTKNGYDFKKIKQHCDDFIVLHSKDDEWVPFEAGAENAKGLEARFLQFENRGHFGSKLPKQEIPELLDEILDSRLRGNDNVVDSIEVFTTRPDTLFGATYMVLAPEHELINSENLRIKNWDEVEKYQKEAQAKTEIERTAEGKEKTGVKLEGVMAINPTNGEEIPIFIADYVLADYGTGAIMAVPAHDERDFEFAKKYNLPIRCVIKPLLSMEIDERGEDIARKKMEALRKQILEGDLCYTKNGDLINSGDFTGLNWIDAKEKITQKAGGEMTTTYRLRDWVFSRQRYWGEPIPLIHCDKCGVVTVPEEELPLELPEVESYEPTGTGESPLATIDEWVNTTCPECGGKAKRETNTMPQWAGSSWYYLRYIDPHNNKALVDKEKEKYWSPVDFYVGGAEHATRHLIYARFWHKFLFDIGVVNYDEPFSKLQTVGLIMAEDGRKMSKRWGNVINPDDVIERFGSDTFRLYEMFMGPFDASIAWSTEGLIGPRKFLEKVWKIYFSEAVGKETSEELQKTLHKTIKKVGEDIEEMKYNTAISAMMVFTNQLEKEKNISDEDFGKFLKILSPFAPHLTQELWDKMGNKTFLMEEAWPEYDVKYLVDNEITLVVQVNGKVRDKITVSADIDEESAKIKALESQKVKKHIDNKEIKKVIFVKGKLISIVV